MIGSGQVDNSSILDFEPNRTWDLALIKGVLIHLNPDVLAPVYDKLARATNRYLLVAEYYNTSPVSISELELIGYGFAYRRDPDYPQDDITWFLMEKR